MEQEQEQNAFDIFVSLIENDSEVRDKLTTLLESTDDIAFDDNFKVMINLIDSLMPIPQSADSAFKLYRECEKNDNNLKELFDILSDNKTDTVTYYLKVQEFINNYTQKKENLAYQYRIYYN
jgi:hypothetical protein